MWRGARRCVEPGPQRGRDKSWQGWAVGPRALSPETPRSLTLPGAEQKRQDSGGAHGEPGAPSSWRSGAGHGGHPSEEWLDRRGKAGYRGVCAGMGVAASLCTSVYRSAHQPRCAEFGYFSSSSSRARARLAYIPPPTPEMTSSGRPWPFSPPRWGSRRTSLHRQPYLSCFWSRRLAPSGSRYEAGMWLPGGAMGGSAAPPPLDGSTDLLCVGWSSHSRSLGLVFLQCT